MTQASRDSLQTLLPDHQAIDWLASSSSAGSGSDGKSRAAHCKLNLSRVVPRHVPRALYLDADVLVQADVCELWDSTRQQVPAALHAALDIGHPGGGN